MNLNKILTQEVDLEFIKVGSGNRHKQDARKLAELADSIKQHGVIQPILLQAGAEADVYYLIAGERRYLAAQKNNMECILARVLPADLPVEEVKALRLVENLQRVDLTPWEEAEQLASLQGDNHTLEELADLTGKTTSWVAQRLAIGKLCQPLKKLVTDQNWPLSLLPVLARVPAELHGELLTVILEEQQSNWYEFDGNKAVPQPPTLSQLQDVTEHFQRVLSSAPWPLDDAKLLPDAGSCKACPKRLAAQALLFPGVKDKKNDRCLDSNCWEKKRAALVALNVEKLKSKKPLLVKDWREVSAAVSEKIGDAPVLAPNQFTECKAKDKGAVPAVMVSGDQAGKTLYVKPIEKQAESKPGKRSVDQETGKPKPKSVSERLKELEKKRMVRAVELWVDLLPSLEVPYLRVVSIAAVFGMTRCCKDRYHSAGNWKAANELIELEDDDSDRTLAAAMWIDVHPVMAGRCKRTGPIEEQAMSIWDEACQQSAAMYMADHFEDCWKKAIKEVELPKSLIQAGVTDPHADGALPDQVSKRKGKGAA